MRVGALTSEVVMVTPSEFFVSAFSDGRVGVVGMLPGVIDFVMCWFLHGSVCIWDGIFCVDEVW